MLQIWALLNTMIMFPIMVGELILGAIMYAIGKWCKIKQLEAHGKELAIAVDQYMNVVWLGNPDETISSRTGRAIESGKPKWYIKYLLHPFVDWAARVFGDGPNHCLNAIEYDEHMENQYEVWKWFKE
jgi:hypothetical protein